MTFRTKRLRYLAEFNPSVPADIRVDANRDHRLVRMDDISEFGRLAPGERKPTYELIAGYSYLAPGDIAYAKVTPCFENGKGIPAGEVIEDIFATTEVTVLRARDAADARYLSWLLQSDVFRASAIASMTGAGGLRRVPETVARDISLPAPGWRDQRQIADYLDHETAEIDAFIADLKLERALSQEHLVAQRERIFGIYTADAPLAELRGKISESDARAGGSANSAELLTVSIAYGVTPRVEWTSDEHRAEDLTRYKVVQSGDIVLNRMRAFQGAVGVSSVEGITSPDYAVLRCNRRALAPEFAANLFKSPRFVSEIARRLRGIGNEESGQVRTPRVSVADLIRIPTRIPDLREQRDAVDEWAARSRVASKVSSDIDTAIALAKERRSALITAAVTGQIDVTTKQPPAVTSTLTAIEESR